MHVILMRCIIASNYGLVETINALLCCAIDVRKAGWDGKAVKESYEWVEKMVAFKPRMKQWQSAVRDGLVEVGVVPYNGFTYDHIRGTKIGGTIFDQYGFRHSAADLLQYGDATRITVLLHATVHRILFRIKGVFVYNMEMNQGVFVGPI